MNRPVVSFCIAAYQRYEILRELVEEILSVPSNKLEVAVCDDRSSDDSAEKIRSIKDERLKVYVNRENVGSSLNIHDALDRGNGRYLFYVNDRDNVDRFKIGKLIEILEELEKADVAFAKCYVVGRGKIEKYRIFQEGKEALSEFACRIDHPTGYIFKREVWKSIKNKRVLFENQNYGDFPITQVCAVMAKRYKGAVLYGDICDLGRRRIDFYREKSRYHDKRKDKRLWYTPEIIFKELRIGQKFLKRIKVQEETRREILIGRYEDCLSWCVTGYKDKISDPVCTAHYNYYPRQDFLHVFSTSLLNGVKLWSWTYFWCIAEDKVVCSEINRISRREFVKYFEYVLRDKLHIRKKIAVECRRRDMEINKREAVLSTYENWVDALIREKRVSEFLSANSYDHVAIYGMGRIGKHLWRELQNSNVQVNYVIDRRISEKSQCYEGVCCYDISAELPFVNMIIVTIPGEEESIIKELRKKVNWEIKSLDDILFVMT